MTNINKAFFEKSREDVKVPVSLHDSSVNASPRKSDLAVI